MSDNKTPTVVKPRTVKPGDPITDGLMNSILSRLRIGMQTADPSTQAPILATAPSGGFIPKNSVFSFSGDGGQKGITPDVVAQQGPGDVLIHNPEAIAADKKGNAFIVGRWQPIKVLSDGTPTVGNSCGPTAGSWEVSASGEGLIALSDPFADNTIWAVSPGGGGGGAVIYYGDMNNGVNQGITVPDSVTVTPKYVNPTVPDYSGAGDTTPQVIWNIWSIAIPSSEVVRVAWIKDELGTNILLTADCEDTLMPLTGAARSSSSDDMTSSDGAVFFT